MKIWEFQKYIEAFSTDEQAEVKLLLDNEEFVPTEVTMDYSSKKVTGHPTIYIRGTNL